MFQTFRPEFMANSPFRLSPDAFTQLDRQKHEKEANNSQIGKGYTYLTTVLIPEVVRLMTEKESTFSSLEQVVEFLHCHGVNLCFLGLIYEALPDKSCLKALVFDELVARVHKNLLNQIMLSNKSDKDLIPALQNLIRKFIAGGTQETVEPRVKSHYNITLCNTHSINKVRVLKRMLILSGIELSPKCEQLHEHKLLDFILRSRDFVSGIVPIIIKTP